MIKTVNELIREMGWEQHQSIPIHYVKQIAHVYANQFKEQPKNIKKSMDERKQDFFDSVNSNIKSHCMNADLFKRFIDYWTEHNDGGRVMRFEMKKNQPFNISRRINTFTQNQKTFNNGTTTKQTRHDKFESAFARADENIRAEQTFDKV